MRFFFKICYATHLTDVNEIWQDEGDWRYSQTDQIWCCYVNIGGRTALNNILRSNQNTAICYVDDTSLRRNVRPVMHMASSECTRVSSWFYVCCTLL